MDSARAQEKQGEKAEIAQQSREIRQKVAKSVAIQAQQNCTNITERKDPEKAVKIIEMLGRGVTRRKIMLETRISHEALDRMCREHRSVISEIREFNAGHAFMDLQRARHVLNQKWDMMEDDPEQIAKTNVRDLTQSVAMLGEGYRAATGDDKIVIEHRNGPTIEDVAAHIKAMQEKARAKLREGSIEIA